MTAVAGMKQISSEFTPYYKKLYPLLPLGILAYLSLTVATWSLPWVLVAFWCLIVAALLLLLKKNSWDLMDEVHDGGDFLLVRWRGEEERIPLSNIMNVYATQGVWLQLLQPGRFGVEIAFVPQNFSLIRFGTNPIVEDLMVRVNRAKVKP